MESVRKQAVNALLKVLRGTLALLIMLIGAENILLSFPYGAKFLSATALHSQFIRVNHVLSTLIGLILIFVGYRLYKRLQTAFLIVVIALPVLIVLGALKGHVYSFSFEMILFVILILDRRHYSRVTDPVSIKTGLLILALSVVFVVINTAVGIFILKEQFANISDFFKAVSKSIELLFFMDKSVMLTKSRLAGLYVDSAITLNWVSVVSALAFFLKPLVYQPIVSAMDRHKARELVNTFGDNPISYVAVENDKKYYFGKSVTGCIAYVFAAGVAVCAGDPVCSADDGVLLINEFLYFCRQNDMDICFCQTTEKFGPAFQKLGFGKTRYGDEAMFLLNEYNLSGKKREKVRYAVNHADKIGIGVVEYRPYEKRDASVEAQIKYVSKQWLGIKKSSELSFMLGSIGLEEPLDKRYFLGYDAAGRLQGFVVFTPFENKNGYLADVTRRLPTAPVGVMEKIIVSAFEVMKNEGAEWGSLGLAPLANLTEQSSEANLSERFLGFIYEKMNRFYGFKALYHYKKNYGPTHWETRYLVYYPNVFSPKIAYSILKAQNPKGVTDYLFSQLQSIKDEKHS